MAYTDVFISVLVIFCSIPCCTFRTSRWLGYSFEKTASVITACPIPLSLPAIRAKNGICSGDVRYVIIFFRFVL